MTATVEDAIASVWAVWVVSWMLAAGWSARTAKTTQPGERALELLFTIAGLGLLWSGGRQVSFGDMAMRLYSPAPWFGWLMVAFVVCGFAFCWWARVHLGKMWSANITLKQDHRIVDTGPYALVRHPIYTGILLASWATALANGHQRGFFGAALVTLGFYLKSRREEKLLITELGPPYEAYRARVPMLVPRMPMR